MSFTFLLMRLNLNLDASPSISGAVQAAVEAAWFAAHAAGAAGAGAGGLVQHGEVRGGGVSGGALRRSASRLPHHWGVGVPEEELGEVGLLQHLPALVHCTAEVGKGRQRGEGVTEEWRKREGEGGGHKGMEINEGGGSGTRGGRGG